MTLSKGEQRKCFDYALCPGGDFSSSRNSNENLYENPLSARQSEVLLWVGEGLTSKAIGEKMGISYRTVESYMVEIQNKMNVSNRQQAVTRAV